jgi:hypothetical protein
MFGGSCHIFTNSSAKWNEYKTDKMNLGKINITSQSSRVNESSSNANYRGIGLSEMAYSIEYNLQHRCSGELSLHVLDIIVSTMKACTTSTSQEIKTTCKKPNYFSEEEIRKLLIV